MKSTKTTEALALEILAQAYLNLSRGMDEMKHILQSIQRREVSEMATLAEIKAKVEAEKTVEDSAVALLQQISQMLKDAQANNDPNALQEILTIHQFSVVIG